jgi:hypothetical protein
VFQEKVEREMEKRGEESTKRREEKGERLGWIGGRGFSLHGEKKETMTSGLASPPFNS